MSMLPSRKSSSKPHSSLKTTTSNDTKKIHTSKSQPDTSSESHTLNSDTKNTKNSSSDSKSLFSMSRKGASSRTKSSLSSSSSRSSKSKHSNIRSNTGLGSNYSRKGGRGPGATPGGYQAPKKQSHAGSLGTLPKGFKLPDSMKQQIDAGSTDFEEPPLDDGNSDTS